MKPFHLPGALLACLLFVPAFYAAAQEPGQKPAAPVAQAQAGGQKPKPGAKPSPDERVLEIRRTAPADCVIKPVMSDAEIVNCRDVACVTRGLC
jgi:hypothetical protein